MRAAYTSIGASASVGASVRVHAVAFLHAVVGRGLSTWTARPDERGYTSQKSLP
jgi:hypothetical protein